MQRREFITLLGSAAAGWPVAVLGAQAKIPRVAVLFFGYPNPSIFEQGFRQGLRNLGYEDGRSIELTVRSAGGKLTELTSLATELIGLKVDVIVAYPTTAGIAVHQQTSEIPVVDGASAEADRRSRAEPSFARGLAYFRLLRGRRACLLFS
jgi:putative ABC transport system substrate-binding protein